MVDKKVDKNAPKRPPTAFFLYAKTRRAVLKNKGITDVTEVATKLGKEWRSLSDTKKKKFETAANKEREKYLKEKAKYDKKMNKNKPPKRPPSSYFLFTKDRRPVLKNENPNLSVTDLAIKLGEEWNNMDAKKRHPYEKEAAKLKSIYDKEKKKWEKKGKK